MTFPNKSFPCPIYKEPTIKTFIEKRKGSSTLTVEYEFLDEDDELAYNKNSIEYATELLTAVTGIKFYIRTIRGYCQRDYAQLIIPEMEATENYIEEIEARCFNTGLEWTIECDEDELCISHAYTYGYKDEDKLKQIREQCDIADDDEIELYEFYEWEKTPKYKLAN